MIRICNLVTFLLFSFLFYFEAEGQKGSYYVKNFDIDQDRGNAPYYSLQEDSDGFLYVANRSGVLRYDGHSWNRIECPGAVYSIYIDNDLKLVAGKFGFGYIDGLDSFHNLSDSIGTKTPSFHVSGTDSTAIYYTDKQVFIFSRKNFKLIHQIEPASQLLQSINIDNENYVIDVNGHVYRMTGKNLERDKSYEIEGERPIFIERFEDRYLIGTNRNRLYIKSGNTIDLIRIDDEGYIANHNITSAKWLNNNLVAVGTLNGGVVFIDIEEKSIDQIINTHTGLSDNEVLAILKDRDNGLWIAQNNGLNRIAPYLPLMNFSHYPGLNGRPETLYPFKDRLYVSTSIGVYELMEVSNYSQIIELIALEITEEESEEIQELKKDILESQIQEDTAEKDEDKGLFGFLKKNKEEDKSENQNSDKGFFTRIFGSKEKDSVEQKAPFNTELQSLQHVYRRVEGIETQNHVFTELGEILINGGLAGIFEIKGEVADRISTEPVRTLIGTSNGFLIASSLEGDLIFFRKRNGVWREVDRIITLNEQIHFLYEDSNKDVWMTGLESIYKLSLIHGQYELLDYRIQNPYSDKIIVYEFEGDTYFVNPSGHFVYDGASDKIIPSNKMAEQVGDVIKYVGYNQETAFINNGKFWWGIEQENATIKKYKTLGMIEDIKFASHDEQLNAFWVLDRQGNIIKLDNKKNILSSRYDLVLKQIKKSDDLITQSDQIRIDERGGNLIFEYTQPDHSSVLGIKYRYKLEGLDLEWSEWSPNNVFKFSYLPPGDYQLQVQSSDIFGQIKEAETLSFSMVPPYWERPWFYAVEFILFAVLLVISIWLNRNASPKYLIINRLLAFLTLILLVEYVQAVGEANFETGSSPVVDFFIQVSIAGALLPVEHYLRKWLIGSKKVEINKKILPKTESN